VAACGGGADGVQVLPTCGGEGLTRGGRGNCLLAW